MARVHANDGVCRKAVHMVLCNGFEQRHAVMADDKLGVVERIKVNKEGQLMQIGGSFCMEEISGRVQIIFNEGWSMDADGDYVQIHKRKQV